MVFPVVEASQVGEARRAAITLARRLGFDEAGSGKVALVVTEAATNLVKHGGGGQLLLHTREQQGVGGIEVLAIDKGPGMADLGRCFRDGYSSGSTPGNGMGAIRRLSHQVEIHTLPRVGTALLARIWSQPPPAHPPAGGLDVGVVHLPKTGEDVCGDSWAVEQRPGVNLFLVADGLGHGPAAAAASAMAVRIFREHAQRNPVEIVELIHLALKSTRGAAVAVAHLAPEARELRFVGVGNISGTIFADGASRSTVSHNGTAGHEVRKIQEFSYPFPRGALLVMHSDGLATSWRLERYEGLAARQSALLAGVLYRDFSRNRDDVTVLAVREVA